MRPAYDAGQGIGGHTQPAIVISHILSMVFSEVRQFEWHMISSSTNLQQKADFFYRFTDSFTGPNTIMSLGGEDLKKTEELPGAFPSEDAITTKTATKPYPEHDLGTHQNVAQVGGANNSGVPSSTQDGQASAQQQPSSLASAANPLSGPAVADDDGFGADNAPNITEDLKAVGSGAATAATAAAIAARDAAVAVKDAAAPVVSAASEQVRESVTYP